MQDQNVMAAAKWKITILQQLFSLFIDQDYFQIYILQCCFNTKKTAK